MFRRVGCGGGRVSSVRCDFHRLNTVVVHDHCQYDEHEAEHYQHVFGVLHYGDRQVQLVFDLTGPRLVQSDSLYGEQKLSNI